MRCWRLEAGHCCCCLWLCIPLETGAEGGRRLRGGCWGRGTTAVAYLTLYTVGERGGGWVETRGWWLGAGHHCCCLWLCIPLETGAEGRRRLGGGGWGRRRGGTAALAYLTLLYTIGDRGGGWAETRGWWLGAGHCCCCLAVAVSAVAVLRLQRPLGRCSGDFLTHCVGWPNLFLEFLVWHASVP